eukprot:tig00001527_g9253.t1
MAMLSRTQSDPPTFEMETEDTLVPPASSPPAATSFSFAKLISACGPSKREERPSTKNFRSVPANSTSSNASWEEIELDEQKPRRSFRRSLRRSRSSRVSVDGEVADALSQVRAQAPRATKRVAGGQPGDGKSPVSRSLFEEGVDREQEEEGFFKKLANLFTFGKGPKKARVPAESDKENGGKSSNAAR